jgi:hypothetical protein
MICLNWYNALIRCHPSETNTFLRLQSTTGQKKKRERVPWTPHAIFSSFPCRQKLFPIPSAYPLLMHRLLPELALARRSPTPPSAPPPFPLSPSYFRTPHPTLYLYLAGCSLAHLSACQLVPRPSAQPCACHADLRSEPRTTTRGIAGSERRQ